MVPRITPGSVAGIHVGPAPGVNFSVASDTNVGMAVFSRARPKSRIFTPPPAVRKIFSGLMSRCTTPLAWAASSPSAMALAMCTALRQSKTDRRSRLPSVWPSSNSITANHKPCSLPMS